MTVSSATSGTSTPTSSNSGATVTTSGTNTSTGIDWNLLIQAAVNAKLARATAVSTKITANQAKITAYQKLQTDLSKLSSDLASLSTSIINPFATNAFAARAATIGATGNVNAGSVLSMTVENGAATGDHTLQISQIAVAHKVAGATQSSQTTPLGFSGTFSLGLAGGSSASITVTSGITFDLLQPTPSGASLNISIGADTDQITTALQTFVTDYNAFRDDVIAQQAANPDGTASSNSVLFGDGTMRQIMTQIEQVLGT